jgi:hypothetical protein
MLVPALFSIILSKRIPLYNRSGKFKFACDVTLCAGALMIGVNSAMSVFHPIGSIRYRELEDDVKKGLGDYEAETLVKFHKGL